MRTNSKGFIVLEIAVILVMLFALAFGIFLGSKVMTEFQQQTNETSDSPLNQTYFKQGEYALNTLNAGFLLIMVGFFVATIILAFMVQYHPIFAFISFFLLVFMIILSGIFSNVFGEIVATEEFTTQAASFNIITEIMNRLPIFITVFGSILIIVMFAKTRGGNEA